MIMDCTYNQWWWNSFVDISEVNRQVIYRNRSARQNISQYIECTRQDKIYIAIYRMHSGGSDQTMNILVLSQHITVNWRKNKKRSVKVVITIWITTNFSIFFHFYFLLRLFMSNFKIISSYHSTINLYTTSMGAESFVKPKKYIAGISDLAALARHSLGSWFEKVF